LAIDRIQNFNDLVRGPTVRRQNPRKLSHLVARDLRGLILRGVLAPGQALPSESDLLQALQVSRNTLREALRILESESLITVRRGRTGGAVVQRPDVRSVARYVALLLQVRGATIGDIQEARAIIEPRAAARLAETIEPRQLELLVALHDKEVAAARDQWELADALVSFDEAVFDLAGNKMIGVLSTIFRNVIASQRYRAMKPRPAEDRLEGAELHSAFLHDVTVGDSAAAGEHWMAYRAIAAEHLTGSVSDVRFDIVPNWQEEMAPGRRAEGSITMAASIATELRVRMATGALVDGDQLPSMPELAAEFEVSRPTMRECLRVLEMEGLVDLRTGSRSGATVLAPTAETAAHLATIVLASEQTRMDDIAEASRLIEPTAVELVATRIGAEAVADLAERVTDLEELVDSTIAFTEAFEDLAQRAVAGAGNPALSVAWEMLHSMNVECRRTLAISALSTPKVTRGNRATQAALARFVAAAERHDGPAAGAAWTEFLDAIEPFFRDVLGDRLLVDLFD